MNNMPSKLPENNSNLCVLPNDHANVKAEKDSRPKAELMIINGVTNQLIQHAVFFGNKPVLFEAIQML